MRQAGAETSGEQPKPSSSLCAICSADSTFTRAAASSIARGILSNRRQTCATAGAVASVTTNDGSLKTARSTKRRVASWCINCATDATSLGFLPCTRVATLRNLLRPESIGSIESKGGIRDAEDEMQCEAVRA